jgi:hypothetical protein
MSIPEVAMVRTFRILAAALVIACLALPVPRLASADGKISLYVSHMVPADVDARRFSRASWGGGIDAVLPWYAAHDLLALTGGLEISNMLSQSTDVWDPVLREVLEQTTSQSYGRFFVGGRVGPHGPGFLRPHVGANLAIVWYGISTDIKFPNPDDPDNPHSKTLESEYQAAFGYDLNAGVDLNVANTVPVEVGTRYVRTFNVPQQLGQGAVSVSPSYIQIYVAVGLGFDFLNRGSRRGGEPGASPAR